MRDVAARAGVSFKTVSRVVNREDGVSPELTQRVQRAVQELDYRPDHRARQLRQAKNPVTTIGFLMVDVGNPFFGSVLRGIEEVATEMDCLVLAASTEGSPDRTNALVDALVERRVDGLIVVPTTGSEQVLQREVARGTPVVLLDVEMPGVDTDLVRSDHHGGAQAATRHLLRHGHRDIAYLGDDLRIFSAAERLRGFSDAMAAYQLDVRPERVFAARRSVEEWIEVMRPLLLERVPHPTALFTAQNFIADAAVRVLHAHDLHRTIAQVGFDDLPLAGALDPGLTTVPQRPRDLGRAAATTLFGRIGGDAGPPQRSIFPCAVVPRGSGEILPPDAV